jgi:hypothetical protein
MLAQSPAGGVGIGLLFLTTLAACIVLGLYTLTYAARCLRVVLQGTSAGLDAVPWPDEPFFDWMWEGLHLVIVGLVCVVPAGIAARALRTIWLPEEDVLRNALLGAPLFWLLFPVAVLSSLSGNSRWFVLRPAIVGGLFRLFPATVGFYFLTAVLFGGALALWYGTYDGDTMLWLPIAAVITGAVVLIYSRLLGRLGQLIVHLPPRRRRKPPSPLPRRPGGKFKGVEVHDPWAIPNEIIQEPPREPEAKPRNPYAPPTPDEIEPYGLAGEAAKPAARPAARRKRKLQVDGPPESPYEVDGYVVEGEPIEKDLAPPAPPELPTESEEEAPNAPPKLGENFSTRRDGRTSEQPVPAHPFLQGVWSFPIYFHCRPHWFGLSLWWLIVGGLLVMLRSFFVQLVGL